MELCLRLFRVVRKAPQLQQTVASPTGTVEGRTRADVRRLNAFHSAGLFAEEVGRETSPEGFVFRAAQEQFVGTLTSVKFGAEEIGVQTARIKLLLKRST